MDGQLGWHCAIEGFAHARAELACLSLNAAAVVFALFATSDDRSGYEERRKDGSKSAQL